MDHQLQELFDFGLKNFGFCMRLIGHNFRIDLIVMIEQKNGFSGYLGAHEPIFKRLESNSGMISDS